MHRYFALPHRWTRYSKWVSEVVFFCQLRKKLAKNRPFGDVSTNTFHFFELFCSLRNPPIFTDGGSVPSGAMTMKTSATKTQPKVSLMDLKPGRRKAGIPGGFLLIYNQKSGIFSHQFEGTVGSLSIPLIFKVLAPSKRWLALGLNQQL